MPLKDVRHLIIGEEGTFVEISVSKALSQVFEALKICDASMPIIISFFSNGNLYALLDAETHHLTQVYLIDFWFSMRAALQ